MRQFGVARRALGEVEPLANITRLPWFVIPATDNIINMLPVGARCCTISLPLGRQMRSLNGKRNGVLLQNLLLLLWFYTRNDVFWLLRRLHTGLLHWFSLASLQHSAGKECGFPVGAECTSSCMTH